MINTTLCVMRTRSSIASWLALSFLGYGAFDGLAEDSTGATAQANGLKAGSQPKMKAKDAPVTKESAWTWGYFLATADKASVAGLFSGRQQSLALYRVDEIVPIRDKPGVSIKPGSTIVRVETAARLVSPNEPKTPTLLFQGVPQHLHYTSRVQRDDLASRSRAELPPSADTVAVVIPIRKSAAWWALPDDERRAHFQKSGEHPGHTAIGANYVDRIYRKLYHTRYAVESTDHDFITYFEFERKNTEDFKRLLVQLRDPKQNPEWNFVDREYEIWMTKLE